MNVLTLDIYTAPDVPKDLNVTNITCNTMILEWTQQELSGGLPVTGYEVVVLTRKEPVYNLTMQHMREFTSRKRLLDEAIEPNMSYRVQLKAINHIGKGSSAESPRKRTLSKGTIN